MKSLSILCLLAVAEMAAKKTPSSETINVHFVPHSHMDAGWLKTFDEYYDQSVHSIFKTMQRRLIGSKHLRYTVGDLAFFKRYYHSLTSGEQSELQDLVERG